MLRREDRYNRPGSRCAMHHRCAVVLLLIAGCSIGLPMSGASRPGPVQGSGTGKAGIPYAAAMPVLEVMRDHLPAALAERAHDEREAFWPAWVARRDAEIRARLARGDEDALVNLWLYGTTFTNLPPARARELEAFDGRLSTAQVLEGRLDDLTAGLAAPGRNERLRFARDVVLRQGIDPTTTAGRVEAKQFLIDARERVLAEYAATDRVIEAAREAARRENDPSFEIAAHAAIFQDRGVASDTSILPGFGIEQVLGVLASEGVLERGSVRRAAIVGPGLDFINKADGYDFYPPQTIQPFALIDSLMRLGLGAPEGVHVTTFDLDPRVNEHLAAARELAAAGEGYVLHLPLAVGEPWERALVEYWARFGDRVAADTDALSAPDSVAGVEVRAVRVRRDVVHSITARDLNIVLERLDPLPSGDRFDLMIATNILVYYSPFEQSLALANAASMLRSGGVFIANGGVVPAPPIDPAVGYARVVYSDRQYDHMFWYRRQ